MTGVGQSCSDYCSASDRQCNKDVIEAIEDPDTLYSEISGTKICSLPLLESCGDLAGAYDQDNQYCYYKGDSCGNITSSCETKTPGYSRFCSCSSTTGVEDVSSSTINRGNGLFVTMLVVPLLFATNSKLAFVLLLLLSVSHAHNWINSGSRSPWMASPNLPCKPARTNIPFAQGKHFRYFSLIFISGTKSTISD